MESLPGIFHIYNDGSLAVRGRVLPGSNLEGLLHRTLVKKSTLSPGGYTPFVDALAETSIGTHTIQDGYARKRINAIRNPDVRSTDDPHLPAATHGMSTHHSRPVQNRKGTQQKNDYVYPDFKKGPSWTPY